VITHLVLFKLKEPTPENVNTAVQKLASLTSAIPTIRSLEVGPNVVPSPRAYDIGLIVKFDDLAGLETYQPHPAHVPVSTYLREMSESIVSVDFEQ
jgi:hypothetical protein